MSTLVSYLPFQSFFSKSRPDSSSLEGMALLPSRIKKRMHQCIKKLVSENENIQARLKANISKSNIFYKINYSKGSPELAISVDQHIWVAVEPRFVGKDLNKDLIRARKYLEHLNPTALRIERSVKEEMVKKLHQTDLKRQKFSQKAKDFLLPFTTALVGVGIGIDQALGTGHVIGKGLSLTSAGYPASAYFNGKDVNKEAYETGQIRDPEGIRETTILSVEAITNFIAGLFFTAFKIAKQFLASELVVAFLSFVMGPFYLLAYGLEITLQSSKAQKSKQLKKQIDEYVNNPRLSDEQKVLGVLQTLRGFVSVTEEEKSNIVKEVRKSDLGYFEQNKLIEKRVQDLHEVKANWLRRRLGIKGTKKFFEEANQVLDALKNPSTKSQGITQGIKLIERIQKSAFRQILLYLAYLIAAIIGMTVIGILMFL